ncbi:hypothetical protein DQP58_09720 [Mycobacterium colombiense]|uniref:Uncharacterized protein n=1 Tax=Mycobacterium colombiense TaxID=339268 RepID=A0A329KM25_9MYCO|nr:DUF5994 family protein [Mycobacterium colombiense]RAU96607.1 hypothetical protein DQP58_09720 [Mycobacterium colombiense]
MTPKKDHMDAAHRHAPPAHTPRLRLKSKAPRSGYVDGAWWPHSDDLSAELPDLLSVLSVRLGPIGRVIYNANEWATPPTKIATGGRTVRIDGYRRQPAGTVEVLGLNSAKIVLLVVSPHTDPAQAHAIMMTAAGPSNASTVENLLTTSAAEVETST